MAIPDEHVDTVCRPGAGPETCAYLTLRPVDDRMGYSCAKFMPGVREAIEERLIEGTMKAQGDNCSGVAN